jgi:hemerythrin-like metal-binding protein
VSVRRSSIPSGFGDAPLAVRLAVELSTAIAHGRRIEWTPLLSVGIDAIDRQHRQLLECINRLADANTHGRSSTVIAALLVDLGDYAHEHFRYEERLLEQHHWPKTPDHALSHRAFEGQIREFARRLAAGERSLATPLLIFLVEWLTEHILVDDIAYSRFLLGEPEPK